MNETLLINIKSLLQIRDSETDLVKGAEMSELPAIDNAWLHVADGKIRAFLPRILLITLSILL